VLPRNGLDRPDERQGSLMDDFERFSLQKLQVFTLLATRSASRLRRLDRETARDEVAITDERAHLDECLDRIEEIRAVGDGLGAFAGGFETPSCDDATLELEAQVRYAMKAPRVRKPQTTITAIRTGRRLDA
jgi:hypothetical protein